MGEEEEENNLCHNLLLIHRKILAYDLQSALHNSPDKLEIQICYNNKNNKPF